MPPQKVNDIYDQMYPHDPLIRSALTLPHNHLDEVLKIVEALDKLTRGAYLSGIQEGESRLRQVQKQAT